MKSGNEAFDSEIRKRLEGVQSELPDGVFETIMRKREKRRGAWFWFSMIGFVLIVTGGLVILNRSTEQNLQQLSVQKTNDNHKGEKGEATISEHIQNESITKNDPVQNLEPSTGQVKNQIINPDLNSGQTSGTESGSANSSTQVNVEGTINLNTSSNKTKRATRRNDSSQEQSESTTSKTSSAPTSPQAYGSVKSAQSPELSLMYPVDMRSSDLGPTLVYPTLTQAHKKGSDFKFRETSPFSLELSAGIFAVKHKEESISPDTTYKRLIDEKNQQVEIKPGLSMDLNVFYRINRHFSAGLGLNYYSYQEQSQFPFTTYQQNIVIDSISYLVLFPFTPPIMITQLDTMTITYHYDHPMLYDITYSSLSAVGWFRYSMPVGRFTIAPQVGLSVRVYTKIKGSVISTIEGDPMELIESYKTSPAADLLGGLNITYAVTEQLGFFAGGSYRHGLAPFATLPDISEVTTSGFGASVGVRWTFFTRRATKPYNSGSEMVRR